MPDEQELDVLSVECPRCGAFDGEPCVTPAGKPAKSAHAARRTAAEEALAALADDELDYAAGGELVPESIVGRSWRELYLACRRELEGRDDFTKLAATFLERMVRDLIEGENALEAAAREPEVVGSTGQPQAHPLFGTARGLEAQALATAKALRLTPDTRPRSGTGDADPGDPLAELDAKAREDELAARRQRRGA